MIGAGAAGSFSMVRPPPSRAASTVFSVLLLLLHVAYGIYRAIVDAIQALPFVLAAADDTLLPSDLQGVRVPQHLAVAFPLAPSKASAYLALARHRTEQQRIRVRDALHDVFRLAAWCAVLGTPELSVYDRDALLWSALAKSRTALDGLPDDVGNVATEACIHVDVHLGQGAPVPPFSLYLAVSDEACAAYRQQGLALPLRVRLNVLSARDDKPPLVLAANQLTKDADVATLRAAVMQHSVLTSDPDLVVICGRGARPIQLYGFPCWAIRIADLRYVARLTQHAAFLDMARPLDRCPVP